MTLTKPKILYIVTQPEFGGAQRYIYDLAKSLRNEFEIVVAAGQPNETPILLRKCEKKEIKTRRLKYLCRQINPIKDVLAIFEIKKLLEEEKPDIVHLNSSKAGVLGSLASFLLCCPRKSALVVYTVHGWAFLEPVGIFKKIVYFLSEWLAGQFRDATIVLSEKEKNISLKFHLSKPSNTFLIQHGIKQPEFIERQIAREQLGIKDDAFAIVTIANFYPTKGLRYLIEAANKINSHPKFYLIGEGPERKSLEKLIEKYNLKNKINLLGIISKAQKYLKSFDLFVLPSLKEGLPYALIEAMYASLPIIATAVGGVPEMIENGKSGILVPPANSRILAEKIDELIKNRKFAENLGMRAFLAAQERFSLERMVNETKKVYESLI
jgi:glycosyltransferase involved in cell wall biosynthesis